jgi:hypothetical protein
MEHFQEGEDRPCVASTKHARGRIFRAGEDLLIDCISYTGTTYENGQAVPFNHSFAHFWLASATKYGQRNIFC